MAEFRILSLDGGGSWALIQVMTLIELYSRAGDGSDVMGHDVLGKFDLIAGNSGGTLTLAGLIKNWSLSDLLGFFLKQSMRQQIFVKASVLTDPIAHITNLVNFGPKYDAAAKLRGLQNVLGADANLAVSNVPAKIGPGYGGRLPHVLFCGFNYDTNRETFFRSDTASLAASRATSLPMTVAQAVHASSTAPLNYFDAPAKGPQHSRWWDGAVGGYNNPVLAAVIEALANQNRYATDAASIKALSIGTGNVALPISNGSADEDPDLVAQRENSTMLADVKKMATSILDDPPDAATFHAHMMLGCPLPGPADTLPVGSRIIRLNPLIQPVRDADKHWTYPAGMDRDAFVFIRDLDMDAVDQPQVEAIQAFCKLWIADAVPNQPVRANSADLTPEIGFGRFTPARSIAMQWFGGV